MSIASFKLQLRLLLTKIKCEEGVRKEASEKGSDLCLTLAAYMETDFENHQGFDLFDIESQEPSFRILNIKENVTIQRVLRSLSKFLVSGMCNY